MESEIKKNNSPKPMFKSLLGVTFFFALSIWCVQDLWNYTLPGIFQLKEITYFEAMRLTLLVHFLFGTAKFWVSR